MEQKIENDLLNWVAGEVCDELYAVALADKNIMVNNWLAFAVLAMYREASSILDDITIPTIDECMAGKHEPSSLANNPKWVQMKSWHDECWKLSQQSGAEDIFAKYIFMPELRLPNFTLGL